MVLLCQDPAIFNSGMEQLFSANKVAPVLRKAWQVKEFQLGLFKYLAISLPKLPIGLIPTTF
jgi:hypothetical protein